MHLDWGKYPGPSTQLRVKSSLSSSPITDLFWAGLAMFLAYAPMGCNELMAYRCVCPGIQSEDQNQFFTFDKARSKFQSSLCDWVHCPHSSIYGCRRVYGRYPLFVCAKHVQRCVKKCPHFECVIHRFVLALNAGTNTLYTRVYSVSSLWMPGQVGVCLSVYLSIHN